MLRGVILIKEMEFDMIIDENSKPREKLKAWYLFTDDFIAGTQHLTNLVFEMGFVPLVLHLDTLQIHSWNEIR